MKVLVFPQDNNPYQQLLYTNMPSVEAKYLPQLTTSHTLNLLLIPKLLVWFRLKGFKIFHLHWLYSFRSPLKGFDNVFTRTILTGYFCFVLAVIKLLNYKLVWTIHNVKPHERTFIFEESVLKLLSKMCDLKVVHSTQTQNEMKTHGMSAKNTKVIPIGTYIDIYKNTLSKTVARTNLNLPKDNFVILFFGMIKPYKGVIKLLETFTNLNLPNTNLIIAGKCFESSLKKEIQAFANKPNIHLNLAHIPDDDVQMYMNACDVVALPFEHMTTSSTVLLAFSLNKTVIAPNIGSIRDIPSELGLFYDQDTTTLESAIMSAIEKRASLDEMGKAAYEYVKTLSWDKIGDMTTKAYKEL